MDSSTLTLAEAFNLLALWWILWREFNGPHEHSVFISAKKKSQKTLVLTSVLRGRTSQRLNKNGKWNYLALSSQSSIQEYTENQSTCFCCTCLFSCPCTSMNSAETSGSCNPAETCILFSFFVSDRRIHRHLL